MREGVDKVDGKRGDGFHCLEFFDFELSSESCPLVRELSDQKIGVFITG